MPIKLPKYVFESAAHEADVYDRIDWDASGRMDGVYSEHCPALWGTDREFYTFFGMLVYQISQEVPDADEQFVSDLADRISVQTSGRKILFGFAGLELTT